MAENEISALNGGNEVVKEEETVNEKMDVGGAEIKEDDRPTAESGTGENGNEETEKVSEPPAASEQNSLPIIIDDLAELGVEWLITKDDGFGNRGKQHETSETLENIDDGQLDIELPPAAPDVKLSSHGQTMHLVPMRDDGYTSTTMTWIRKTAVRKDSGSDRRITIRGVSLGDLFNGRIYTLIQMCHAIDYSSTDRSLGNTCNAGILTLNFRTILDRLVALRRYLLDLEIPGRRLEIVCTFPDHKRPPDFETLWQTYAIEGVPPCASLRPDREILARQLVVKNIPAGCDEIQIRKYFGTLCDEVEFVEDYDNHRCAIVTFLDVINCHVAHARQHEIVFEDGSHPQIFLMTDMVPNSKYMPHRAKEETEEERHLRHTFELLWNHQQRIANAMHMQERYGGRAGSDYQPRRTLQSITKKLPTEVKQRVEDRAHERRAKEIAEKEKEKAAIQASQQETPKEPDTLVKTEPESKNGAEESEDKASGDSATPHKRPADTSPPGSQAQNKRARRNRSFRGASGGIGAGMGMQRRGMSGNGGGNRRDLPPYQRGDNRGPMHMHRGGAPSPRPIMSPPHSAGRYGAGGGYMNEMRTSPWLVPPGAGASTFDRHLETASGSYGTPSALMARRDMPPLDHGVGSLFGTPSGGMAYQGGYIGREMDMRRSGGGSGGSGELYQRRDTMGPDYGRTDYRGFYGKR